MSASAAVGTSSVVPHDRWATIRAVSLPVIAGLLVRAIPVLTADFPLNDGGLFYTMTRDLQAAHYLLPATTTYNGLGIPFAYPPLGFYAAGLLSGASGIDLLDVFRFLPLLVATAVIPVVYLLAREILPSRFQAILATWAFALLPRAFDWLVLGGGLTRSLGLFFAVLTILEGIRFYRTGRRSHGLAMAVLAAMTALSHPSAILFVALSMALMFLGYGRTRSTLRDSVLLAVLAAVLASPWWLAVISVHGLDPFVSGGQTGVNLAASFQYLVTFDITDEPYMGFLAALGVLGVLRDVSMRRWLRPAWVILVFIVDVRSAATSTMVPLAMLIAVGVDEVLLARLARLRADWDPLWPTEVARDRFGRLVLGATFVLGLSGAVKAPVDIGSPLHALDTASRDAMSWISTHAPPSARFIVVTGSPWFIDATSEWFPVLADRPSVATVQGYEWKGKAQWTVQERRSDAIQVCAYGAADCVVSWMTDVGVIGAWIYVPTKTIDTLSPTGDCCAGLRASLASSGDYAVVYGGPGGMVFAPRP